MKVMDSWSFRLCKTTENANTDYLAQSYRHQILGVFLCLPIVGKLTIA